MNNCLASGLQWTLFTVLTIGLKRFTFESITDFFAIEYTDIKKRGRIPISKKKTKKQAKGKTVEDRTYNTQWPLKGQRLVCWRQYPCVLSVAFRKRRTTNLLLIMIKRMLIFSSLHAKGSNVCTYQSEIQERTLKPQSSTDQRIYWISCCNTLTLLRNLIKSNKRPCIFTNTKIYKIQANLSVDTRWHVFENKISVFSADYM